VLPTLVYHWRNFDNTSCAIQETCVFNTGNRLLLRFATNVINIGNGYYWAESPYVRPDLFVYAFCHQHYHENGFAFYWMTYPENDTVALQSLKRSYCVETSGAYQTGPKNPCTSNVTCSMQGLEPGNYDSYGSDLDCQWLEVTYFYQTNAINRWYLYNIAVNQHRSIIEYSHMNNLIEYPVFLPCAPSELNAIIYSEFLAANPEVCCFRPGGLDPTFCPGPAGGCANAKLPTCPALTISDLLVSPVPPTFIPPVQ